MNRNIKLSGLLVLLVLLGVWFYQDSPAPAAPEALSGLQRSAAGSEAATQTGALPERLGSPGDGSQVKRVAVSSSSEEAKRAKQEKAERANAAPKGPWLKGVVLSVHGAPVADVEVTIKGQADAGIVQLSAFSETTQTDKRGEFKITRGLWPALPLKIDVVARGYELFSGDAFPERQTGDEFLGEFRIQPAVILGGFVVSHDGTPVPGATVWRSDPGANADLPEFMQMAQKSGRYGPGTVETDEEGRFELLHEPEGDYVLNAIHEHYPPATLQGTSLPAGTAENRLQIEFDEAATISGRIVGMSGKRTGVTVEASLQDAQGTEAATSMIAAMGLVGAGGHKSKLASDGSFTIYGLPMGERFDVQAFVKEGIMNKVACSDGQEASSGDTDVELKWNGGASLTFKVQDAVTGKPISQGAVRYRWIDSKKSIMGNARKVQNFESSTITIDELRPDPSPLTMELRIYAEGYLSEGKEGIEVRSFEKQDLGTIQLRPSPKFRVQVLDGASGEPIRRARIVLYPVTEQSRGEEFFSLGGKPSTGKTDREGWCELDARSTELGKLTVRRRGYAPFDLDDIPMSRGDDQTEIVRLHPGAVVTVSVTDSLGQEASGIQVEHKDPEGERGRRETDRNGRLVYKDLIAGEHFFRAIPRLGSDPRRGNVRIEARSDGGSRDQDDSEELAWEVANVSPGSDGELSLKLDPTSTLNGIVTRRGVPVSHAQVTFVDDPEVSTAADQQAELQERVARFGGRTSSGTTTDGQGHFSLSELPMGKHSLRVKTKDGGPSHFEPLDLFEGTSFVTVRLPGSAVEGKVVDQDDNPVSGASLTLRRMKEGEEENPWAERRLDFALDLFGGSTGDASKSDSSGHYMIDGIPEDQLLGVEARASGYVRAISATFKVDRQTSVQAETIKLQQAGSLKVLMEGGMPMFMTCSAKRISEGGAGPSEATAMAQDGFAVFADLGPGEWEITTRRDIAGSSPKATAQVLAGQQTEVTLQP